MPISIKIIIIIMQNRTQSHFAQRHIRQVRSSKIARICMKCKPQASELLAMPI